MWVAICFILAGLGVYGGEVAGENASQRDHWSFRPLRAPVVPDRVLGWGARNPIDRFVHARLKELGLRPSPAASKEVLHRRVALVLTGLPPRPEDLVRHERDRRADAGTRLVQTYLDSPRYAERWAKHWLDAAGYADSNGYFSADTDRPLAYRYRDYAIRSMHRDKPFDQFVREQIAGDELSGWSPGRPVTPETLELLEATHFLRNGQDGTGESDGNPDEVRVDRYYALESSMQIIGSSLLGMTVQCSKCHDHKFEPLTQADYYAFQAFLYPAFNIEQWVKPNDRVVDAALPGELENWKESESRLDVEMEQVRAEWSAWLRGKRPAGNVVFQDSFDRPEFLEERWSNRAPGDDVSGGEPAVQLNGSMGPAARVQGGQLQIIEGGGSGDRWISTRASFEWRPAKSNEWIEASFLLKDSRVGGSGRSAERMGWMIAMHDFNDNSAVPGGNLLIDGNPGGSSAVYVDYPGSDMKNRGSVGSMGYVPGKRYGLRVTRTGEDRFTLQHLVDEVPDGPALALKGEDLAPGGFGFEYCCGRSFEVDDVRIETSRGEDPVWLAAQLEFEKQLAVGRVEFERKSKAITERRSPRPGRIAWVSEMSGQTPAVHLLKRGNPKTPGEKIEPAFPAFLSGGEGTELVSLRGPDGATRSKGRRLAWAKWVTKPGSAQAGLLARNMVNRVWQHHFGTGIVATPDNLGRSGAKPTHPELLEWLAHEFVSSGWSLKKLHALILDSAVFRQSSASRSDGMVRDPANRMLWRYPLRRLDAEAIRDGMLAASGRLGNQESGPYVPTSRNGAGEVVVDEAKPGAFSRSIFLQQRRTQVATLLGVFDAPSIVFTCSKREPTTMPLQALNLLNSGFAVKRGADLAERVLREAGPGDKQRLDRAYLLAIGRRPDRAELNLSRQFLDQQRAAYAGRDDQEQRAWADLGQSLFLMNSFLYLE